MANAREPAQSRRKFLADAGTTAATLPAVAVAGGSALASGRAGAATATTATPPMSVFDGLRASVTANRSRFFHDLAMPFFGYNKPAAKPSHGVIDSFWMQGMPSSVKASYDCIKAFSETDFTEALKKMTFPALVIQGDADQIVPFALAVQRQIKILPKATSKAYADAPHGLCVTDVDKVNAGLLEFLKA
jgi:non-heme chloroperoxidase